MKRWLVVVVAMLACVGCASVPRTATYQTQQWKEVEEPTPSVTRIIQADIPQVFPRAKKGRKYLNIGHNPVNPNRALAPGEVEFILPVDAYVETIDRDGKHVRGWLRAGERVIGVPTNNPYYYKAIWIRRCGNDLFNEEKIAILIRVRREVVSQETAKQWKQVPVATLPPVQPVAMVAAAPVVCREKSDKINATGSAIGGFTGSLISGGNPLGTGLGAFTGWLLTDFGQSVYNFFWEDESADCIIDISGKTVLKAGVAGGVAAGVQAIIGGGSSSGGSSSGTPPATGRSMPGNAGGGRSFPGN